MTDNSPPDLFPARLRAARELRKMSQSELAEKADLPSTSISHFEGGTRKPSFDTLRRIADKLKVTADYLLGRVELPDGLAGAEQLYRHAKNLTEEDLELAEQFMKMLEDRRKVSD